jgi:hypothetical protein
MLLAPFEANSARLSVARGRPSGEDSNMQDRQITAHLTEEQYQQLSDI